MNSQLLKDLTSLKQARLARVQKEIGVTFQAGVGETNAQFCRRLLTEIDNQGKLRALEQLLTE